MKIYTASYKGLEGYTVENDFIRMVVLPELGAKIASLVYKPQSFEVFFQPAEGVYRLPDYGADFAKYDTSGADEMFPTIDCCFYPAPEYHGIPIPDHGELWSIPWQVHVQDGRLAIQVTGVAVPYVFNRTITLCESTVHIDYQVTNTGNQPLYGLWAFHGLVACDEMTRLLLPNASQVINVHDSQALGPAGTKHAFPISNRADGTELHLDIIGSKFSNNTEKFYVDGRVAKGEASLSLNRGRLLYRLLFPHNIVPYLGVWINEGGFKGEYNCALEPSTGYYDSLDIAYRQRSLDALNAGETLEWYLNIELQSGKIPL